jgi:hypothetical protein
MYYKRFLLVLVKLKTGAAWPLAGKALKKTVFSAGMIANN